MRIKKIVKKSLPAIVLACFVVLEGILVTVSIFPEVLPSLRDALQKEKSRYTRFSRRLPPFIHGSRSPVVTAPVKRP